jgi:arylsulfatase A
MSIIKSRWGMVCLLLLLVSLPSVRAESRRPNIVIILTDDLGYGDLGCYGHPSIRTPNIDRMAAEGLRFTDFYAGACICTPSRAALLTGRLPIRSGMAGAPGRHVIYPNNEGGMPAEEITIPRALKSRGYTSACIGKWHLGDKPQFLPTSCGFDYFYGLPYVNDMNAVSKKARLEDLDSKHPRFENFDVPLMRGTNTIERPVHQDTLTKRYTGEAIRFIQQNKKRPFFLYFAHTFPHVPLFASEKFKGKSARGLYGDTVEEIDWSVGEVLKALREEKLEQNTLVIFTSDNGPWLGRKWNGGSAGLLRDGKGGTWEGGYRVPAIARWPGKIKPGTTTHEMASGMDLFNTALVLAGVPIPNDRPIDGKDLFEVLFHQGASHRDLHFYYYSNQLYAVRKGCYKAHFFTHDGYSKEPAEKHDPPLLFDLNEDPSERFNVAAEHPEIVAQMKIEFEKHRAEVIPGKEQY